MAEKNTKEELLTAAKWAEKIGVTPAKFKKAIGELQIQADIVKANCNYYSKASADKVKKSLS